MSRAWESPHGRDGSKGLTGGPLTREFFVLDQPSLAAAIAAVEGLAAVSYEGRERKNLSWRSLGYDLWQFTATYGAAAAGNDGLSPDQFNFRITGTNAHINQSFQTLARVTAGAHQFAGTNLDVDGINPLEVVPDGVPVLDLLDYVGQGIFVTGGAGFRPGLYTIVGTGAGTWVLDRPPAAAGTAGGLWHLPAAAPDMKGAIGQDKDSIQGCDVVIPSGEFALMAGRDAFTHADYRALKQLVGKVSDRDWKGYPAGTLMYLGAEPTGAEGTFQDGQPTRWWCLAHQFRHEEHQTNVRLGDILLPYVPAFSYTWCRYGPRDAGGALAMQPTAAYVERVHRGFFNPEVLGIP